jgi:hypothetical protein
MAHPSLRVLGDASMNLGFRLEQTSVRMPVCNQHRSSSLTLYRREFH